MIPFYLSIHSLTYSIYGTLSHTVSHHITVSVDLSDARISIVHCTSNVRRIIITIRAQSVVCVVPTRFANKLFAIVALCCRYNWYHFSYSLASDRSSMMDAQYHNFTHNLINSMSF